MQNKAVIPSHSSATGNIRLLASDEHLSPPEGLSKMAAFPALDSWTKFVSAHYGLPLYRLVAEERGQVTGLLALVGIKHFLFGSYLASAPFASYGGFAFCSREVRDALLEGARGLAGELNVDYVNVRFGTGESLPPDGWIQHPIYSTYRADLSFQEDALLARYSSDHRNHIRKSLKKGFRIRFGLLDLLEDAYQGLARSMHELGSPYHSRSYLQRMAESLGPALEFAVVYAPGGELAGAGAFILQGEVVTNLHANILRRFRPDYAGEFLYWSAIQRYGTKGLSVFDFGRSLNGSGNETFKMKWRPRRQLLAYWYALREGARIPDLNQKNPRFQLAIWLWKRLPAAAVRPLGPWLIKGLA
ncbi:MAG TPA: GNAT family N-acetyltransferase [Anaerolineales bacterium]|nr:GNAT family N-acetyltransferase [Anaerolineales bacterium]